MEHSGVTSKARLLAAVAAVVLLAAGQAAGDDGARVQFRLGVELYKEGDYEQAAMAFERAYELKPSYKILFNLGQCHAELKHYAAALDAYTRYLVEGGDEVPAKRVGQVGSEIARLKALVGEIVVECPVEGAKVKVDNVARGKTPLPGPIFVDLGQHEVVVKHGQRELFAELIKVGGGERVKVVVEVDAEQPEPPEEQPEPAVTEGAEPADDEAPERLWTWVAFGVGGAAGVAGGVIGGVSIAKKNDFVDECGDGSCPESRGSDREQVKSLSLAADVLYGVAAAGVITGIVLYFVEPGLGEEEGAVAVTPTLAPDRAGIAVGGRF